MADRSMFGKSKFGGGFKDFKRPISVDENEHLTFRYVPPILKFTEDWAVFHRVHWGYKGSDRKKPGSTQSRTFRCPLEIEYKTKRVITPCSEHAKIEEQETLAADKEAIYKAQGMAPADIEEMLAPFKKWLKDHNVDSKWYSNILTESRKLEVLKYPHKAKQAIEKAIKEYKERLVSQGQAQAAETFDPNDPDGGCWFTLSRTGTGTSTDYSAKIVEEYEQVDVGGRKVPVARLKSAALSDADLTLIEAEAVNLTEIVRVLTPDQIDQLVNSSGSPEEVDAIFNQGQRSQQKPSSTPAVQPPTDADFEAARKKAVEAAAAAEAARMASAKAPSHAVPVPAPSLTVEDPAVVAKPTLAPPPGMDEGPAAAPTEDDEEAMLERKLAETRKRKAVAAASAAAVQKAAAAVATVPQASEPTQEKKEPEKAPATSTMPDQEFLKLFGKK